MRTLRRTTITCLAAATAAVSSLAVAGSVSAAAPEEESADPARVERVCARVDNLTTRTQNMLDRIQGDAETRGSLLWLDRRIENALENDRADLAELLEGRKNVRQASIAVLDQRLALLADADATCADAGF